MSDLKRGFAAHGLPAQAGASVLAALVVVAVLGAIVALVTMASPQNQPAATSATPISASVASQPAAVEVVSQTALSAVTTPGTAYVPYGEVTGEQGDKGNYKGTCDSGMDYTIFYGQNGAVQSNISSARKRCVPGDKTNGLPGGPIGWGENEPYTQFMDRQYLKADGTPYKNADGSAMKYGDYFKTDKTSGALTEANRTCTIKSGSAPPVWDRNVQWKCLVRVCVPAKDNTSNCEIHSVNQGSLNNGALFQKQVASVVWQATAEVDPAVKDTTAADIYAQYGTTQARSDAIIGAFQSDQKDLDLATTKYADARKEELEKIEKLAGLERDRKACGKDEGCLALLDDEYKQAQKETAEAKEARLEKEKELAKLGGNVKPLDVPDAPPAPDCSKTKCDTAERNTWCTANPNGAGCPTKDNGNGNRNGNGNNSNGNGNGGGGGGNPFSTFGQATQQQAQCPARYICQGNAMYYYPGNYGGVAMQPQLMNQCPQGSGCQQPAAQQQSGISQYLPIIGAMASMFGGGNSNSSAAAAQCQQMAQMPSTCTPGGQNPNGNGTGTDGQPCQQPQPPQPDPAACTSGRWQPQSAQGNGCVTGWQCVPSSTPQAGAPKANLSCQPKTADIGMSISVTWACDNSTAITSDGFLTNGAMSGTTTASLNNAPQNATSATYTLTCKNDTQTSSAQCKIDIVKPSIVLVANPKNVPNGQSASLGWITTGMQSCKISNTDFTAWSAQNASNTNVNGAVQTPPITKSTLFVLDCLSLGGETKEATVQINVQ